MHDIAHLTAMELLKSLTETETLEDKSILRHAQSIYESASDFPKRELVRACPLRRVSSSQPQERTMLKLSLFLVLLAGGFGLVDAIQRKDLTASDR